ncbi:glycosyltransferase [Reyranella sp. CPCC 100927]|nr:glycosyltransferase [Reyranella sp. CPCC 100927]
MTAPSSLSKPSRKVTISKATAVDILFVHTNFPGQFKAIAHFLAQRPDVRLHAIGSRTAAAAPGVNLTRYSVSANEIAASHSLARRFEIECRRAEQVIYAANALRLNNVEPRLIFVHPGWGESIPLRELFPQAHIVAYAEFFYRTRGADLGFDPESGQLGIDGAVRVSLRNASTLLAMADADAAIAPTQWQKSLFPTEYHAKIRLIHDGIDTKRLAPAEATFVDPNTGHVFRTGDETVTYVARNLEPYRGFHIFMRALPRILRDRPHARVLIAGGDGVSYGTPPDDYGSWREKMLAELDGQLDRSRVHMLNHLRYEDYVNLLRVSRVHTYLTYPFVLSWSILEAMSLGCVLVASDTAPVTEVIEDGVNGLLTPFFDPDRLAERIVGVLANPRKHAHLGRAARARTIEAYDFEQQTLPKYLEIIRDYADLPLLR